MQWCLPPNEWAKERGRAAVVCANVGKIPERHHHMAPFRVDRDYAATHILQPNGVGGISYIYVEYV